MRMTVIAIFTALFLVSASSLWAGHLPGAPEGWVATPKLHIKGQGTVKNNRPDYITGYGYYPSRIKAAYGISGNGAGQTIAIVDAYGSPTITYDLLHFCYALKLPQADLRIYYPGGLPASSDSGWAVETTLDVEWVHALAPSAKIALVIAPTNSGDDLFDAVQYAAQTLHAQVVSMGWGGDEFSDEAGYDSYFQNTGTVFITASGDSGSGGQYPAASPNVVAAGGTALYLQPGTGTLKFPEVAWEGSGGGVSQYEPMPAYQASFGLTGGMRCVPDVAFLGDPNTGVLVYDSVNGWYVVGGTSVSAQCWAAIVALADQLRAAAKLAPLTDGHQALYTLAGSSARYNVKGHYRDITAGYNGDFAALAGYDFITGLGSPMAGSLVPALKLAK
ncbi:MAG: S53 family peptidase [Syntrophobacteraceae bacterium]